METLSPEILSNLETHISSMPNGSKKRELIEKLKALRKYFRTHKIDSYFPDAGPLRRELYPRHMECVKATATKREVLFLAANRIGKTELGADIVATHLTGRYPHWWDGKRFNTPTDIWAGGDTATTARDIIQLALLGPIGQFGTGMIPAEYLIGTTTKRNVPDAVETISVRHISGGTSTCTIKSYDQGRRVWQGTAKHMCWIDEECPFDVYTEALLRTMTTDGIVLVTFTPLQGLTDLVLSFMEDEKREKSTKCMITATWDDAPHLTQEQKEQLWASIPPHERDSRAKGIPSVGAGRIYPVKVEDVTVDDFPLPAHWPRCYALDVGWNKTACGWFAWDRESDTVYLYAEHYMGEAEPAIHAEAIKRRGEWIPGVVDPAARGRNQKDGERLIEIYAGNKLSRDPAEKKGLGLTLTPADNAVEAGIYEVWQRFTTGRFKIFKSCRNTLEELPLYHRDENGKIVKKRDHMMDVVRYGIMSGLKVAKTFIPKEVRRVANVIRPEAWT